MRKHPNRVTVTLHNEAWEYVINCSDIEHISRSKVVENVILDAPVLKVDMIDPDLLVPSELGYRMTVNLSDEAYSIVKKRAEHDNVSLAKAIEAFVYEREEEYGYC